MVQRVVCGTVDDVFKRVAGDHIGIMNLYRVDMKMKRPRYRKGNRTNILQKLTNTKRPKYNHRWRGNRKMKRWYGTDCKYPSTGWNAWDAKGVGTEKVYVSRRENRTQRSRTYPFVVGFMEGFV